MTGPIHDTVADSGFDAQREFVTATIGGQMFGLPILRVQDVFVVDRLTRVPLAPAEIAGVLNLRGRIVTIIDMRTRLGLERTDAPARLMAIGVESRGESHGLLVDAIGEVMKLDHEICEAKPANLDPRLAVASTGIYRLDGSLLIALDLDKILEIGGMATAA
ncbi:MAG: chemotaxis protein CheW [Pseudolabrys sp.]